MHVVTENDQVMWTPPGPEWAVPFASSLFQMERMAVQEDERAVGGNCLKVYLMENLKEL